MKAVNAAIFAGALGLYLVLVATQSGGAAASGDNGVLLFGLMTALALVIAASSATAQAQIAIGHLADYSGGTSDVGTPYGQAVADTFAWVNKNGGVAGKQVKLVLQDDSSEPSKAAANRMER